MCAKFGGPRTKHTHIHASRRDATHHVQYEYISLLSASHLVPCLCVPFCAWSLSVVVSLFVPSWSRLFPFDQRNETEDDTLKQHDNTRHEQKQRVRKQP